MNRIARQAALERVSYLTDRRNQTHGWPKNFDATAMTITIEMDEGIEVSVPAVFEVCNTCNGKGTHVNPSIDCMGISEDDFDRDPGFRESYFAGAYDQTCNACEGKRVYPVISPNAPDEIRIYLHEQEREEMEDLAMRMAEARMGC